MSHGLRAAISSSGSVSRGVAFQREEKTLLRRGTSPRKQNVPSVPAVAGQTLVPALCPARNYLPRHPGSTASEQGEQTSSLHSHLPQEAGGQ